MQKGIFYLFLICLIAGACSKTGPTGSQGAAGATGAAGPQGPAGPTGPQGNANVFTDTFSLASADWLWNSGYTYSNSNGGTVTYFTRYHDAAFSKITQGMLDSGMVMVYIAPNANDFNQWSPLPYTFLSFGAVFYYNYVYETMPGKVRLHFFYTANGSGTPPTTLSADVIPTHKYKIVAVTGTVSTAMKRDKVNVGDYRQVMNYLGMGD
ncbi:hypothetical protein [Puia sp.]|jgi:hypothetical protein|uniref:hypothetical protein n=1 Tax=Puia sp. TaxID=2045100 RepID=UPI002F3E35AF